MLRHYINMNIWVSCERNRKPSCQDAQGRMVAPFRASASRQCQLFFCVLGPVAATFLAQSATRPGSRGSRPRSVRVGLGYVLGTHIIPVIVGALLGIIGTVLGSLEAQIFAVA